MNKGKIKIIIAAACVMGALIGAKPMTSYATTVNKQNTKTEVKQEAKQEAVALKKINIFTGKEVKTTEKERTQEFRVIFNGDNHNSYFNNKNLQPKMRQTEFHSQVQEKLYNYLMNPDNRWAAEDQAVGAHNGILENNCVFFVSSALRNIGIKIPMDIGYTTNLERELTSLGWEKETDLNSLEAGDICFAGTAHTYVFMGWANKAEGVAWIADNQYSWYGSNFHPRDKNEVPSNDTSKTTCYYRLPGNVDISGANNVPDMPENYNYTIGTSKGNVNVRQSPTTESSIVGTLTYGERVKIIGQTNDWFKIRYNKQDVYVYAPLINGKAPAFSKPYEITDEYPTIKTGVVDFKGGPVTNIQGKPEWGDAYYGGQIANGTKVSITGESNGWYRINYQGGSAWIIKDRVNVSGAEKPDVSFKEFNGVIAFKDGSVTNIQQKPEWGLNLYKCQLSNGTNVKVVGESGNWYKIEFDGTTGWVVKDRLEKAPEILYSGIVNFTGGPVTNIQTQASWGENYYAGQLSNGTKVSVLGESNGWYKIKVGNKVAWIIKDRLNKVISTVTINFTGGPVTNIQTKPSWGENYYAGQLSNGTKVDVIGESNGWYKISCNGKIAWVLKERTQK